MPRTNTPASVGFAALSSPGSFHSLARPLSDSGGEADGPGFLCTNQGGICSLTDMSPLTQVSSHIHYSSSARWAAVKASEQSGRWVGGGGVVMGACRLFQLPTPFQHSIVSPFPHEDGRPHVTFHQINCGRCHGFIAFPHTLPVSFISALCGGSEERTIWTASSAE